jgi:hypothetical protein
MQLASWKDSTVLKRWVEKPIYLFKCEKAANKACHHSHQQYQPVVSTIFNDDFK